MSSTSVCGCDGYFSREAHRRFRSHTWLPELSVAVHATISGNAAKVTLKQTYQNPSSSKPILQVLYHFPLYDGVSVVAYDFLIGDRELKGVVMEREHARSVYEDTIKRGETAGLMEEHVSASDVFTMRLGNVPPATTVVAKITYIGELKHDAEVDGIRFTIPTAIAPRYGYDDVSGSVSSASRMTITADVVMPEGNSVKRLISPSHPVSISLGTLSTASDADPSISLASASLALDSAGLDEDFVLQIISMQNNGTPIALLEKHPSLPDQYAVMLTFVPRFTLTPIYPEIVFVADRSGSMGGWIPTLIKAMNVFVKSLPVGVKFNICSFGSQYEMLWETSRTYNQTAVDEALRYISTFNADFGGTETESAVRATFENRLVDMPLECLLLTDGDIMSQNSLFRYIEKEVKNSNGAIRLFSLGIGDYVSHALVEGVARAGNGFCQVVLNGEPLTGKVIRMLKGALTPHIEDYSLELKCPTAESDDDGFELVPDNLHDTEDKDGVLDKGSPATEIPRRKIKLFDPEVEVTASSPKQNDEDRYGHLPKITTPTSIQAPQEIRQVYPINRTNIYILFSRCSRTSLPTNLILKATSPDGPLELDVPIKLSTASGQTIHQLAARKVIQDLEDHKGWIFHAKHQAGASLQDTYPSRMDELAAREGVKLGLRYQIASKWTSFLAAVDTTGKEKSHAGVDTHFSATAADDPRPVRRPAPTLWAAASMDPANAMLSEEEMEMGFGIEEEGFSTWKKKSRGPRLGPSLLEYVIQTQVFSGSWELEHVRLKACGYDDSDVDAARGQLGDKSREAQDAIIATVLMVAYLEEKLGAERDVWELVVEKARSWLQEQVGAEVAGLVDLGKGRLRKE